MDKVRDTAILAFPLENIVKKVGRLGHSANDYKMSKSKHFIEYCRPQKCCNTVMINKSAVSESLYLQYLHSILCPGGLGLILISESVVFLIFPSTEPVDPAQLVSWLPIFQPWTILATMDHTAVRLLWCTYYPLARGLADHPPHTSSNAALYQKH